MEVRGNESFLSSVVGDFETWDGNPGDEVASFSFFFFIVNRVKKDRAVVTRRGDDEIYVDWVEHDVAILTDDNDRVGSNDIDGDDDANNSADIDDHKNTDNDNKDDAVFTRLNSADLPFFLTGFVGVTIGGGTLRFVEVLTFGGILFFVFFAMVRWLFRFQFGNFYSW